MELRAWALLISLDVKGTDLLIHVHLNNIKKLIPASQETLPLDQSVKDVYGNNPLFIMRIRYA
jgi:hypothetical protein